MMTTVVACGEAERGAGPVADGAGTSGGLELEQPLSSATTVEAADTEEHALGSTSGIEETTGSPSDPSGAEGSSSGAGEPYSEWPDPEPGPCGGCEAGEVRCVGGTEREICAPDEQGCVRWREHTPCEGDDRCRRGGECTLTACMECGYDNYIEPCQSGVQRLCRVEEGCRSFSDARACDADAPPPHCNAEEDLGVLRLTPLHGLGSCIQLSHEFDGPCGPCSWHQCVEDEQGAPHFRCVEHGWPGVAPEDTPPGPSLGLGYDCPAPGGPIQGNGKVKRGGTNPWTVASHYNAHLCPRPVGH